MKEYEDNTPNAARLLESLRSSGYNNYSAICDIIDNSFDANADMIKVEIGESGITKQNYIVSISDNGDGMDIKTLDQAMRLGSITKRETEDLGKYGMGLVTASISLGRRLTVITKNNGQYFTAIQDLDEVSKLNKFVKVVRPSNNAEIARFEEVMGGSETGTIITVQKVDNLQNKNIGSLKAKLLRDCGQIYRYFLNSNKKIYINGSEVKTVDPLMLEDDRTETFLDITEQVKDDNGDMTDVRLRIVCLPKLSKQESELPSVKINQTNQGFYLIRNNREIASGQSLNLFTKHNQYNRFRAEIFFTSTLDRKMGTDFTKSGSSANGGYGLFDDIRNWIEHKTMPQLSTIKAFYEKEQKSKTEKVDHSGSSRVIESKASVIKKPRIDRQNTAETFSNVESEAFTNVEFTVESNTRLAPLVQYTVKGKDVEINYNNDHPFYQQVYSEIRNNPDLTRAIDFVFYSMTLALIDITSTADREILRDEFIDRFSDNLRALLS